MAKCKALTESGVKGLIISLCILNIQLAFISAKPMRWASMVIQKSKLNQIRQKIN